MNEQNGLILLRRVNEAFAGLMNGLSVEQLNTIPRLFNNNIVWNFAHSLAMQQEYFYRFSNLPYTINESFINQYKKGTKPDEKFTRKNVDALIRMFTDSINQFEKDFISGLFRTYVPYATSIGFTISNIEDAVQIALFHDGWHFGIARTLRKHILAAEN